MLLLLSLSILVSTCHANLAADESSYLNGVIPRSVHQESRSGYPHERAHFGKWYTGEVAAGVLTVPLHLADSELCDSAFAGTLPAPPFFWLVNRTNECSFVTQVRTAQHAGAAGVIIANHLCRCDDLNCTSTSSLSEEAEHSHFSCETQPPIVKDDGSGHDVSIPSVLISKLDGIALYQALIADQSSSIVFELAWHASKSSKVNVDLWHTPSVEMDEFLCNFSIVAAALGDDDDDHWAFTPHMMLLDGASLRCDDQTCNELCTNEGRYCAASTIAPHVTGKAIAVESLRRMCIWKHSESNHQHWWTYVAYVALMCPTLSDSNCVTLALDHANIEKSSITSCIQDSGGWGDDVENALLAAAIEDQSRHGVLENPTMIVNGAPIVNKPLTPSTVLQAICNGYPRDGLAPHVCYACASCLDPVACVSRSSSPSTMKCHDDDDGTNDAAAVQHKHGGHFWGFFMALMMAGIGGASYLQYQRYLENLSSSRDYTLNEGLFGE